MEREKNLPYSDSPLLLSVFLAVTNIHKRTATLANKSGLDKSIVEKFPLAYNGER